MYKANRSQKDHCPCEYKAMCFRFTLDWRNRTWQHGAGASLVTAQPNNVANATVAAVLAPGIPPTTLSSS